MKRHLEGRGYATDTKFGEVRLEYQDCVTIITTNDFPFGELKPLDCAAILARCLLCTLKMESYSAHESFPFNEKQLAHYLLDCQRSETKMEKIVDGIADLNEHLEEKLEQKIAERDGRDGHETDDEEKECSSK